MYAFKLDNQDRVRGVHSGKEEQDTPVGYVKCSQADAETVRNGRIFYPHTDIPRWTYTGGSRTVVSGTLSVTPDTRPQGGFIVSPGDTPGADIVIDVNVGDAMPPLILRLSTNFNGERRVSFDSGHQMRLTFTSGRATILVPTTEPFEYTIRYCDQLQLVNAVRVRILAEGFYKL